MVTWSDKLYEVKVEYKELINLPSENVEAFVAYFMFLIFEFGDRCFLAVDAFFTERKATVFASQL